MSRGAGPGSVEPVLRDGFRASRQQVLDLYESVQWTAYTRNPDSLMRALENSDYVAEAWDGQILAGLVRCISDGATILYLQDVLVRPSHQRHGLGRRLVKRAIAHYPSDLRQIVLITDDQDDQRGFYESLDFVEIRRLDKPGRCFVQYRD